MKQLHDASVEAIGQIQRLLRSLGGDDYGRHTEFSSSTIGAHVRHVIDHYSALRSALADQSAIPRIDFNRRQRRNAVEQDLRVAMATLEELSLWLQENEFSDCAVEVESEVSLTTTCNKIFRSTLSRELCYLINHTVHHAAYMNVIAKQLGVRVENTMGVAPATGSYLRAVDSRKDSRKNNRKAVEA